MHDDKYQDKYLPSNEQSIKNWIGPSPNGPRSVSCDRAIRYSGLFGVRSVGNVGDFLETFLPLKINVWKRKFRFSQTNISRGELIVLGNVLSCCCVSIDFAWHEDLMLWLLFFPFLNTTDIVECPLLLSMEEMQHQLIGGLFLSFTAVFYIPDGAGFLPSTVYWIVVPKGIQQRS